MNMQTRHELTLEVLPRYLKANKQGKTKILDEYCANAGYKRKYAITKLRIYQLTAGIKDCSPGKHKRKRERTYDMAVEEALHAIWDAYDNVCAERMHPQLGEMTNKLIECGELKVKSEVEMKIKAVSLGTLKVLLKNIRIRKINRIGGTTKPGSLLKNQIPFRVGLWDEEKIGFSEIDLVAHCGNSLSGEFVFTLNTTDIKTGWFEAEAVLGKSQEGVFNAIKNIREKLPFSLLGIDSDNGTEFINWIMVSYCEKENIVFTRSRPYQKNDNAHIEQKNWTTIRKNFGYTRIETKEKADQMNKLYKGPLRDYINFFLPSMKCTERERVGSRIIKKYDVAKTPYQRIIGSNDTPIDVKKILTERYSELNPIALRKEIDRIKKILFKN